MRWAMVGSGTRKARAISSVVRPPSRRRVSATLASGESTGWQEMKTSRNRSSPMGSSRPASDSSTAASCSASSSQPSSSCFRSASLIRRNRSPARRLAVAMSQAPGLSGTEEVGHCSSAATRASWASSSARSKSRTIRMSPAMSLADSIRQTASMARWASDVVTWESDQLQGRAATSGTIAPAGRWRSASDRRFDGGDVDFPHGHHGLEGTLRGWSASGHHVGQDAGRDLPADAPLVFAPAALAFLAAVSDNRVPVPVRLLLVLRRDLERKGFAVLELRPAVQSNARDSGDDELHHQGVASASIRIVGRGLVDGSQTALREGLRVEACSLFRITLKPETDRVLAHLEASCGS